MKLRENHHQQKNQIVQNADISSRFPWKFFIITFSFSWIIWLPCVLAAQGLFELPIPEMILAGIGAFGPTGIQMVLSVWITCSSVQPASSSHRQLQGGRNPHILVGRNFISEIPRSVNQSPKRILVMISVVNDSILEYGHFNVTVNQE